MNTQLEAILNTKAPKFQANIRNLTRKEIAANVRKMLKANGIKNVSVTSPSYSMAQSIDIRLPDDVEAHNAVHAAAEIEARKEETYRGMVHFCAYCKERSETRKHLESIILSAFPDLDDRSDTQSDYFNYRLSFS